MAPASSRKPAAAGQPRGRAGRTSLFPASWARGVRRAVLGSEDAGSNRRSTARVELGARRRPIPRRCVGPLGHRTVADNRGASRARRPAHDVGLLLARHRFELGVYRFFPTPVRHIDGAGGKTEAPTHYLNLDAAPGSASGSVDRRIHPVPRSRRSGSLRWFVRRRAATRGGTTAEGTQSACWRSFELGVMSHYSGDVAVPYHAAA